MAPKKRYLCSQLVPFSWSSSQGSWREAVGNLESIWTTGAELCLENPLPIRTVLRIRTRQQEWRGLVSGCRQGDAEFFVEVKFAPRQFWTPRRFVPEHLFDPAGLADSGLHPNA